MGVPVDDHFAPGGGIAEGAARLVGRLGGRVACRDASDIAEISPVTLGVSHGGRLEHPGDDLDMGGGRHLMQDRLSVCRHDGELGVPE